MTHILLPCFTTVNYTLLAFRTARQAQGTVRYQSPVLAYLPMNIPPPPRVSLRCQIKDGQVSD